ncbi:YrhB domain-containing protein [Kitasatospora xanthocidica]|uniref:YrhB domain-containing protein n=1 Tax=Kitasatospora xanthocidica TaxID=83382 RepID=UPI001675FC32|nr:YrhB domain-containing protein [Kitasatospora xanthocidica]
MISKERAVALVESLLAEERLTWAGPLYELAVYNVEEHAVGWVVFWNTAEYARTHDLVHNLVGSGPYLVDRHDGSIHHIPAAMWPFEDWEELYLRQVKGVRTSDPLVSSVRALVDSAGVVAAMSHLRKQAPRLSLREARDYVMAVRDGVEPSEELADLTREAKSPHLSIETLVGPVR